MLKSGGAAGTHPGRWEPPKPCLQVFLAGSAWPILVGLQGSVGVSKKLDVGTRPLRRLSEMIGLPWGLPETVEGLCTLDRLVDLQRIILAFY